MVDNNSSNRCCLAICKMFKVSETCQGILDGIRIDTFKVVVSIGILLSLTCNLEKHMNNDHENEKTIDCNIKIFGLSQRFEDKS